MELSWAATNESHVTRLEMNAISRGADEDGYFWVNGEIKNTGPAVSKIITLTSGFPDNLPLESGQNSFFTLVVPVPEGKEIKRISLFSEAY
jgi:hypothetical protein